MPHVSRHTPEKKVTERIYTELLERVTSKGRESDRKRLYNGLMTPTERIMFSKRLAIICMLGEGYTFEDIQEILRVSPSTIGRIWEAVQKGKYKEVITALQGRDVVKEILDVIEAIRPPGKTEPRWKWTKQMERKHR